MKTYTSEEFRKMNFEEIEEIVGKTMYRAGSIFEFLEGAGKIYGNGHHIAQKISEDATNLLKKRWMVKK